MLFLNQRFQNALVHTQSQTFRLVWAGDELWGNLQINGKGLESQESWCIEGEALVTDVPITFLGFVNRITGEIEEEGHPLNGKTMKNKILIFPKGSGSTVAPYVLLGLFYKR